VSGWERAFAPKLFLRIAHAPWFRHFSPLHSSHYHPLCRAGKKKSRRSRVQFILTQDVFPIHPPAGTLHHACLGPLPNQLPILAPRLLRRAVRSIHIPLYVFSDFQYYKTAKLTPPGAGVNQSISNTNRTVWPLTGGSLNLALHHPATPYIFVNLALGSNASTFNISLIGAPSPLNETGNGTFCLPQLVIPEGLVQDGDNASIQVVTINERGSALYNVRPQFSCNHSRIEWSEGQLSYCC